MTRKQKFQTGDLVVLRRAINVVSYPDGFFWDRGICDAIKERIGSRFIGVTEWRHSPVFKLKPGSIGVVKSYDNVFMLDHDRTSNQDRVKEIMSTPLSPDVIEVPLTPDRARVAYINKASRKHLTVLVDGSLITFPAGGKLFEPATESAARSREVRVTINGALGFVNVNEKELKVQLEKRLTQVSRMLGDVEITSVEYTDRDGNVKRGSWND